MKTILFRADAKPGIGTGDLVSLIQLSKTFSANDWNCLFLVQETAPALKLMEVHGIRNVFTLPEDCSPEEDLQALRHLVAEHAVSHLFACITERPLTEYGAFPENIKKACINFDGIVPAEWALIVNWNFPDDDWYPSAPATTKKLLGPEYVILPENFDLQKIEDRVLRKPIQNILIAMGGADEFDLTTLTVTKFIQEQMCYELTIVLGPGFQHREKLDAVLKESKLAYRCLNSVSDMFSLYLECDAAIATGGLTSSELVATKTPSILVAAMEHQERRCRYFHEKDWAVFMGHWEQFKQMPLQPALAQLEVFEADRFTMKFSGREKIYKAFAGI